MCTVLFSPFMSRLASLAALAAVASAGNPFQRGNLLVLRLGDGNTTLGSVQTAMSDLVEIDLQGNIVSASLGAPSGQSAPPVLPNSSVRVRVRVRVS